MLPMIRNDLISRLEAHVPFNTHEAAMLDRVLAFVRQHPDCFERTQQLGHVTASAWVVNEQLTHVLLTHHAKLGMWLQMGGHCDGDADVLRVALREVREESGLAQVEPLLDGAIFDVDAHVIPARKSEPEHVHYDVRFLIRASMDEPLRVSEESHDVAWVEFGRVKDLNTDQSVLRLLERTLSLRNDGYAATVSAR